MNSNARSMSPPARLDYRALAHDLHQPSQSVTHNDQLGLHSRAERAVLCEAQATRHFLRCGQSADAALRPVRLPGQPLNGPPSPRTWPERMTSGVIWLGLR